MCGMQVAIWLRFVSETTGQEVELEEFSLTFFDFDQDWADGDKAYVTPRLLLSDRSPR